MKQKIIVFIFLLLAVCSAKAQIIEVPGIPDSTTTKEALKKMEQDIVRISKWLEATPIGKDTLTRRRANAFVVAWLIKTENLTLKEDDSKISMFDLFRKNSDLLIVFLAGNERYLLERSNSDDLQANIAGVRSAIICYNLGGNVVNDDALLKAIEAEKNGKLEGFIKQRMGR